MDNANLPLGTAEEPHEEALQPLCTMSRQNQKRIAHTVSFPEGIQNTLSQSSTSYKDALSQPAPGFSHRERLQWLQKRRAQGLWVQCDDCDRWRHLPHIVDKHELPKKWFCSLNPDKTLANCSAPEVPICLRDEEDLIHSEYSAGSVVWALMPGYPWWPAMVDDCPDNEQFYWLDGFSDIPTHYNVVFFDTSDVTRAWVAPNHLKPYNANKATFNHSLQGRKYKKRLQESVKQADDANMLPLPDRLAKYSFIARYKGPINRPKKIDKEVLAKFKKQLKREFNINFSDDSSSDESVQLSRNDLDPIDFASNTNSNVLILGTPKKVPKKIMPKALSDLYKADNIPEVVNGHHEVPAAAAATVKEKPKKVVEPDSMTVQIGSSELLHEPSPAAPDTKVMPSTQNSSQLEVRIHLGSASPSSDDFDF